MEESATSRASTYLNFGRSSEQTCMVYKRVFGTEFSASIFRFKDIPSGPDQPPVPEADKEPVVRGHAVSTWVHSDNKLRIRANPLLICREVEKGGCYGTSI